MASKKKGPEKRSVAQRMRERGRDIDAAVDAATSGKKVPKIGGAIRPADQKKAKAKKKK